MREVVDAFRAGGGAGKPMFLQVALSFAPTDDEALAAALDQWRQCALPSERLADLATSADFDRAVAGITAQDLKERLRISSDVRQHIGWLQSDVTLGFERIFLHNVARNHQEWFIDIFGDEVLPKFT